MKRKLVRNALFILTALLVFAPACWAKANGYCYVVGYSFSDKRAFFSPIIIQKVNSKSYSDEEFVTDVELTQKLESQFQSRLSRIRSVKVDQYTISARGAFKSNTIADGKLKAEIERYETKGFTVKIVTDFVFSD